MFNLSPKNDKFFDMFISFSEIILEAAVMLRGLVEDPSNADEKCQKIKDVEHAGDEKQHDMFQELNNSFITPIDREDIHAIAKAMDDILDYIESTASRYAMFNIKSSPVHAVEFADLAVQSSREIIFLMTELKAMGKSKAIKEKIVEINRIENLGDAIFRKAVREMFQNPTSTLEVIIWKEMYECLENIVDSCEDVANIVEGVVMKHA